MTVEEYSEEDVKAVKVNESSAHSDMYQRALSRVMDWRSRESC